jgi:molybdate transport system substrate-binding protein
MRLRVLGAALVVASLGLAAVALAGGSHANRPRLTVFAAASLTDVFPQLDSRTRYSFGGSNMLAAQIEQGQPADVLASADTGLPWQLHREGLVTRPVVFTANKLVIVTARGNPLHLRSVHDLERSGLKIVLAAAGVPVGDYTRRVLRRLGLSDLVDNAVGQELSQVALGQADAGFVYATDAKTVKGEIGVIELPKAAQPRVLYAAAAVKSSKQLQAAKAWVHRLLTRRAQRKLRAAGFLSVPH